MSIILHTIAVVFAALLLYKLWKKADVEASDDLARQIIAVGFLLRAVPGVVIFWISYFGLPFAQSLQLGNGFWFFGLDGKTYFGLAGDAAHQGLRAIVFMTH